MFTKALFPLKPGNQDIEIIAFDTEDNSKGVPGNFICACFYSEKEQKTFFNIEEAREYLLLKRSKPVIFVAHNLAYDLANLDYPAGAVQHIVSGSKMIGGLLKYNDKITRFIDTGNFFIGESIKSLGAVVGDDKIEFDIAKIKNKDPKELDFETLNECAIYCMKDAKICYLITNILKDLTSKNNSRFKSFTAGSLALRIFRTNFMKYKWPTRPQEINNYERCSYYGGRTEVFNYNLHQSVHYEDINSSYPTAMYFQQFPVPWDYNLLHKPNWNNIKDKFGIVLATVEVPKMRIPPLPYKHPKSGKLIFPHGCWTAAYTTHELNMALKYGVKIKHIHSAIIYGSTFSPFKEYIEQFHKLKSNSKGLERSFYKMLMNSLSGKLGEKRVNILRIKESDFSVCNCPTNQISGQCKLCNGYIIDGQYAEPNDEGWITVRGERLPDPTHSFPCLIAYITSYGRIKLYEDRLKHQDAIYCDTDSCITEYDHPENRGEGLGKWEDNIYANFLAYAPKFYTLTSKKGFTLKLKGVPKSHMFFYKCSSCSTTHQEPPCKGKCLTNHMDNTHCKSCNKQLDDNEKFFTYEKPIKLSEAIFRNKKPNNWELIEKSVSLLDDKRIKKPNGDSDPLFIIDNDVKTFEDMVKRYEMLEV